MKAWLWVVLGATAFGCGPKSPGARAANDRDVLPGRGGLRWISPDATRTEALGASQPAILAVGAGAPGDNLGGRILLPAEACGLFMARGSGTIEDLDLFVYGDDGAALGEDETASATPTVVVCPPHPDYAYAFGRVAAGHGLFAVSAQIAPRAAAERIARAVGTTTKLEEAAITAGDWPGLDEAVERHRAALGTTLRELRRAAVPLDPRLPTRLSATTEAHGCVDLLTVPGEDVADVEIAVMDGGGRVIGRSPTDDSPPAVVVCSDEPTNVIFELRPRGGRGLGATVTSLTTEPKVSEAPGTLIVRMPTPAPALEEARRRLDERLDREGYGAPTSSTESEARVGRRVSLDLELREGCSRIDVVAGAPTSGIDAWLWSSSDALAAHAEGSASATLFGCVAHRTRLDVEGVAHGGPIVVEVRPLVAPDPALVSHPLAAGRLLSRFLDEGRLASARELFAPHVGNVSSVALASQLLPVPAGHCMDAGIGLGVGAEGAEIRILDASDDQELAASRGMSSALAATCAPGRGPALKVRVEARAEAGAAQALVEARVRSDPAPRGAPVTAVPPSAAAEPAPAR